MMERFVDGFKTVRGVTYQVPIANSERGVVIPVDFVLRISNDCPIILEFHVPRDWRRNNRVGDFRSLEDYKQNRTRARALRRTQRHFEIRQFQRETRDQLLRNYRQKLRARIDQNSEYVGAELIVVTSGYEFYRNVIRRFGQDFPCEGSLVAAFNKLARIKQREDWSRDRRKEAA
jgi:hypothetical protein